MPRALVLSHSSVAHELGHLHPWLADNDLSIDRLYREHAPELSDADLLIVLGSPTSVATGHCEPPAAAEVEQVAAWIGSGRPYLGICFGAQVLSLAMGGHVDRLPAAFVGYVSLDATGGGPVEGPWLVWHNDAITAPPAAKVLGRLSHADLIFRSGRAWGVQPHIEATPDILDRMGIALGAADDVREPLVAALRADEAAAAQRSRSLLDAFAADALA